jgi:hypothetical protein
MPEPLSASCLPARGEINDKPIANVLVHDAVVGLVDLIGGDQLDVGLDVADRAVVDDLLSFANAAGKGPGCPRLRAVIGLLLPGIACAFATPNAAR